jgi:hypothetical protein
MFLLFLVKKTERKHWVSSTFRGYRGGYMYISVECSHQYWFVYISHTCKATRQNCEDATVPVTLPASIWEGEVQIFVFFTW